MDLHFSGVLWYWRGPAPFHFVTVPEQASATISELAPAISYGWGMIPVSMRIGASEATTSLWPKDGGYIVPVKTAVRVAESLELGDMVEVALRLDAGLV